VLRSLSNCLQQPHRAELQRDHLASVRQLCREEDVLCRGLVDRPSGDSHTADVDRQSDDMRAGHLCVGRVAGRDERHSSDDRRPGLRGLQDRGA
jgi:hypothetical protein